MNDFLSTQRNVDPHVESGRGRKRKSQRFCFVTQDTENTAFPLIRKICWKMRRSARERRGPVAMFRKRFAEKKYRTSGSTVFYKQTNKLNHICSCLALFVKVLFLQDFKASKVSSNVWYFDSILDQFRNEGWTVERLR